MTAIAITRSMQQRLRRFALVLGTNEIASAVSVYLQRDGWAVLLSHDPYPPVVRRKMAFHDALYDVPVNVEGISAARADSGVDVLKPSADPDRVTVTRLSPLDALGIRSVDVLIDARMQKYRVTPDLRRLARLTIGLGPGFTTNANCDIAVETRPAKNGAILRRGRTDAADGIASRLGDMGMERFVYSQAAGHWRTNAEIGAEVSKDTVLGRLDGVPVLAPLDGVLRGLVRDGTDVPERVKLVEVDPRGNDAQWTGIDQRGRTIAIATLNAIRIHSAQQDRREAQSAPRARR
jgi:xanthine dehydrogenase accessory factor